MNSEIYTLMMEQMQAGAYTEVSAKRNIGRFLSYQQITAEEYDELMEYANSLAANTDDGEINVRLVALETDVKSLKSEVQAIKEAVESGGTTVTNPDSGSEQTGETDDPIDAYRGMTYYKDKYYRDSEDGQVYKCYRDSDTDPGAGVQLNYLPHELVNIYFYFDRVS